MPKVTIELVAATLNQAHIEPEKILEIVGILNHEVAAEESDKEPAIKKQYVVLVSDPEGKLPKDDFVAWVLQVPEDANVNDTVPLVWDSAWAFNVSKKGRLLPVKTVGDAIENVSAKFFKERNIWVKTKTPVLVLRTDNVIPDDETVVKGGSLE